MCVFFTRILTALRTRTVARPQAARHHGSTRCYKAANLLRPLKGFMGTAALRHRGRGRRIRGLPGEFRSRLHHRRKPDDRRWFQRLAARSSAPIIGVPLALRGRWGLGTTEQKTDNVFRVIDHLP